MTMAAYLNHDPSRKLTNDGHWHPHFSAPPDELSGAPNHCWKWWPPPSASPTMLASSLRPRQSPAPCRCTSAASDDFNIASPIECWTLLRFVPAAMCLCHRRLPRNRLCNVCHKAANIQPMLIQTMNNWQWSDDRTGRRRRWRRWWQSHGNAPMAKSTWRPLSASVPSYQVSLSRSLLQVASCWQFWRFSGEPLDSSQISVNLFLITPQSTSSPELNEWK